MDDLKMVNVGGGVWSKVKSDSDYIPEFNLLRTAHLWGQEVRFKPTVWQWLCEGAAHWSVEPAKAVMTGEGKVFKVSVHIGDKDEHLHYGDVTGIMKSRPTVDLIWIEVSGADPLTSEVFVWCKPQWFLVFRLVELGKIQNR